MKALFTLLVAFSLAACNTVPQQPLTAEEMQHRLQVLRMMQENTARQQALQQQNLWNVVRPVPRQMNCVSIVVGNQLQTRCN